MDERPIPYQVQAAICTQILVELIQKHPELLAEVKDRLGTLPAPVSRFIFLELRHRSHDYDLKELTKPWSTDAPHIPSSADNPNWSRGNIRRTARR